MSNGDTEKLDPCGCCQASAPATPEEISNRPALSAIRYRVGSYASFRQAMVEAIAREPRLRDLTARTSDDYGIALIEMWAYLADILTFYQERTANEAFLRTARLRESLLRLAALLDYKPAPGMAATTYLAFTLEQGKQLTLPSGLLVQSVPGQDEQPQKFETIERFQARAAWNTLAPQLTQPQKITKGLTQLYLSGVNTRLQPGDAIVIVGDDREKNTGSERWDFRILQTVEPYPDKGYTLVTWLEELGHDKPSTKPGDNAKVFALRQRAALFGHNAPDWRTISDEIKKVYAPTDWKTRKQWPTFGLGQEQRIFLDAEYPKLLKQSWIVLVKAGSVELYRAADVASAAHSDFTLTTKTTRIDLDTGEHLSWFNRRGTVVFLQSEQLDLAEEPVTTPLYGATITLDQPVSGLLTNQVLLVSGKKTRFVTITSPAGVVKVGITEKPASFQSLSLVAADGSSQSLKAGDRLSIVRSPTQASNNTITWYLMSETGFTGSLTAESGRVIPEPAATDDERVVEQVVVQSFDDKSPLKIILRAPLQHVYDRSTVTMYANVVQATHGETVADEVLGNGDAANAFQAFTLKKSPVTYVSEATQPHGAASTLQLRIGDIRWQEIASLFGQAADGQVYTTTVDADGKLAVRFGDGQTGARLPTGRNNVVATYRQGLGAAGNVGAGSLTTLLTHPVGLKGVTNPAAATGGAEAESLEQARSNAPNTVRTFDRVVSLRDFEDAAREYSGITKARAAWAWLHDEMTVQLTVTGTKHGLVSPTVLGNLRSYLDVRRDPNRSLLIASYTPVPILVEATISVTTGASSEKLQAAALQALLDALAFAQLDLGQSIHVSEIYKILQGVSSVVSVDIDTFQFKQPDKGTAAAFINDLKRRGVSLHTEAGKELQDALQPHLLLWPGEMAYFAVPATDAVVSVKVRSS